MSNVVKRSGDLWLFHCPGCGCAHFVNAGWTFNGDLVRPTIRPSVLVYESGGQPRCHSFVTDGRIQFLADSTHALAEQTVPLPPWDDESGGQKGGE